MAELRNQMAYVGQDIVLFNDTLYNNIAYGGMHGCAREQVEQAMQRAHVDEFLTELPAGAGYDYW